MRRDFRLVPGVQKYNITLEYDHAIEVCRSPWNKSKQRAHVDAVSLDMQRSIPVHLPVVGQPRTGWGQAIQVEVIFVANAFRVRHQLEKHDLKARHGCKTEGVD